MYLLRFKEWHILSKIITISIISVFLTSIVILFYFLPMVEQKMLDTKKEGLKNVVDVTYTIFQRYDSFVNNGEMTLEQAKQQVISRLKEVRYGDDNSYFWINDLNSIMIMHPIQSELDGVNLTDMKDSTGKYFFREFVSTGLSKGSGFVDYMWPKPGNKIPVAKSSYIKLYRAWGWIIGSGVYMDDVQNDIDQIRFYMLLGTLLFITVTIFFAVVIGTGITGPLQKVIEGLQDIASGKGGATLTKRIAITSIDEIGVLSAEFNLLMESINRLAVFKKVIEEDDGVDEVYRRIGDIFTEQIGFSFCFIYQVLTEENKLQLTYPRGLLMADVMCDLAICDDNDLCKAKRTGHTITSTIFPSICRKFTKQKGLDHTCIPIIVRGATVAVVQVVFDLPNSADDRKAIQTKIFKAEQYIEESLAVIETKRLMRSLQDLALIDALTGLHNRRYLQEHTEKIVAGTLRRGKTIGLIMCDLDYFKQVNDSYGHNVGDMVLKETSKIICQSIREADIVIRFGGEEFLIVLLDTNDGESISIAEKIRSNIEHHKIKISEGFIQKTISLGVSEFPADTDTLWSGIKFADVALYRAKDEGRNRTIRFTPDMWTEDLV